MPFFPPREKTFENSKIIDLTEKAWDLSIDTIRGLAVLEGPTRIKIWDVLRKTNKSLSTKLAVEKMKEFAWSQAKAKLIEHQVPHDAISNDFLSFERWLRSLSPEARSILPAQLTLSYVSQLRKLDQKIAQVILAQRENIEKSIQQKVQQNRIPLLIATEETLLEFAAKKEKERTARVTQYESLVGKAGQRMTSNGGRVTNGKKTPDGGQGS